MALGSPTYTYKTPQGQEITFGDPTINRANIPAGSTFVGTNIKTPAGESFADPLNLGNLGAPAVSPVRRYDTGDILLDADRASLAFLMRSPGERQVEEDRIREQRRSEAAALIAAQNELFNRLVTQEQEAGAVRAAQTRGLNVRAGLVGSTFASAAAEETAQKTREKIANVEAQRAVALANIEKDISADVRRTVEENRRAGIEEIATRSAVLENLRTRGLAKIGAAAKAGGSFDEFSRSSLYSSLLDFGLDDLEVRGAFMASVPQDQILDTIKQGGNYIQILKDPVTGAISTNKMDLTPYGINFDEDKTTMIKGDDGNFYVYDKTTNMARKVSDIVAASDDADIKEFKSFFPNVDITTPEGQSQFLNWKARVGAAGRGPEKPITSVQAFDRELKLAADFERFAKESRTALRNVSAVETSYKDALANLKNKKSINAQSQVVINAFNKIVDPPSVIRESEYARSPQGEPLIRILEQYKTRILAGGAGLTKEGLEEIKDAAISLSKGFAENQTNFAKRTKAQAEKLGELSGGEFGDLSRVLTPDVIDLLEGIDVVIPSGTEEDYLDSIGY